MQFTCPNCKLVFPCTERDYPITCRCGLRAELKENQNVVYRYINAVKNWRANGSPVRSDGEIAEVLTICQQCKYFDNGICRHKKCGCTLLITAGGRVISRLAVKAAKLLGIKPGMFEKIKMATEHCPIKRW